MKTIQKTTGIAAIIAVGAVAGLASQGAVAAEKHHHATTSSTASSSAVNSMERRLEQMEAEMQSLRSDLARARTDARQASEKVDAQQQQVEQELAQVKQEEDASNDLLFFRGGFTHMSQSRNNELLLNNQYLNPAGPVANEDGDGWYVGAGFDHRLTSDMWGMSDMIAVDGEVMFQYMNFGSSYNALIPFASSSAVQIKNQLTQLTITASPKIKFNLMDGALRPWIIPFGLSINVISPPSSGVTVLDPGLQLGTGVEYQIWKSLWAGIDFRYNFTGGDLNYKTTLPGGTVLLNKTNIDGLTTGAYLGFGF
ncbi:hypothetical protein SAMN02949497_1844 [Methylomagnum ishizawai]|uniref:Outer membrane protein beta-barrel domain-containing protein n=1 Tax=Methylomagnum ishizawai TaxID=1760988 RepID=A0A1Y6CW76_9GAMM|nr:hypothetical protein [Methylomagnum ishizawai]SMF94526.1 hypothetical protein SAMN02949497_1844 [Methylomagnum ishizawai]